MTELAPIVLTEEQAQAALDQLNAGPPASRVALSNAIYEAVNAFVNTIVEDQWCVLHRDYSRLSGCDTANDQAHQRFMDAAYTVAKQRLADRRAAETAEGLGG